VRRSKAREPATAEPVNGPHGCAKAGELKRPEATSPHTESMLAVYDGRRCVGHLLLRGKAGVEAYDAADHSLGLFPTERAAADAISAKVVS
jgi:hypothetical protein